MKETSVPQSIAQVATLGVWHHDPYTLDRFAHHLNNWRRQDIAEGSSAIIALPNSKNFGDESDVAIGLDRESWRALINDGAIPDFMLSGDKAWVNEYFCVSLAQMCGEFQKAWEEHKARIETLRGTPHGTLPKAKTVAAKKRDGAFSK